jgi:hypothetical protein
MTLQGFGRQKINSVRDTLLDFKLIISSGGWSRKR